MPVGPRVRGSSVVNMFSHSKMSEFDPRRGVSIFQISLKFKNVSNIHKGGGSSLFGTLSEIFLYFNYDFSPYLKVVEKS